MIHLTRASNLKKLSQLGIPMQDILLKKRIEDALVLYRTGRAQGR